MLVQSWLRKEEGEEEGKERKRKEKKRRMWEGLLLLCNWVGGYLGVIFVVYICG